MLGQLADCYVFASNFPVTPWVAATTEEPQWTPHDREVQGVVELPLDVLLDERSIDQMTIERGPLVFRAPCIRLGHACIWGATSVILSELGDVLRQSTVNGTFAERDGQASITISASTEVTSFAGLASTMRPVHREIIDEQDKLAPSSSISTACS